MKKEYYTDFSLSYRSLIPSPVFFLQRRDFFDLFASKQGRLSSNSCSAALICVFVLREEFAFLFQTFSRSDPHGKAQKEKNITTTLPANRAASFRPNEDKIH